VLLKGASCAATGLRNPRPSTRANSRAASLRERRRLDFAPEPDAHLVVIAPHHLGGPDYAGVVDLQLKEVGQFHAGRHRHPRADVGKVEDLAVDHG
jgi:hypothetical protein